MTGKPPEGEEIPKIELRQDGWERFEHAVDAAVKSGPKHKSKANAKPSPRVPSDAGKSKQRSK
jgi:hypothetical protein